MYKIVLSRAVSDWGMEYLKRFAEVEVAPPNTKTLGLVDLCQGRQALLCRGIGDMSREFFEGLAKAGVKVVASHGTGLDGCDLQAATEFGIPVVYAPGANARSVAEYTVTLMLTMLKELHLVNEVAHSGDLSKAWQYQTREFKGMKLYVIGFGNIGRQVAQMCMGLGMTVSAYDKYMTKEQSEQYGCQYCEGLYDGVAEADIVSVHTPLTEETRGLANKEMFDMMKPGSYFVNTARPDLMDEDVICDCLESGKLAGAALDASSLDKENPNPRILANKKIVLSYHVAARTAEALDAMAKDCSDGIEAVLNHCRWPKTANPEVYDKLKW